MSTATTGTATTGTPGGRDGKGQIKPLNAIRGLAAFIVVMSHLEHYGFPAIGPSEQGSLGVMVFFTLSGFLMGHLYLHKPLDWPALYGYVVARFSRIAPPYLIVVLASIAIYNFVDPSFPYAIDSHNALRHLLFSGNVSVMWSIPPEVQFYALFIGVWFAVHKAVARRNAGWLLAAFVLGLALVLTRAHVPGTFVGSKLTYFAIGTWLGWLHRRIPADLFGPRALLAVQLLAVVLFALYLAEVAGFGPDYWNDVSFSLLSGLAIFAFSRDVTPLDRWLHAMPLQKLGDWSFSIYLVHAPVLHLLQKLNAPGGVAGTLLALAASIGACALFSIWIEHPACNATRRLLLRHRPTPSDPVPVPLAQQPSSQG